MAKKSKTIACILFLLALIALKCFLFRFDNLDEIWHYNLCRGITSGALPYRDINLVGMPLYYLIFSLPLFIAKRFIIYRITEVCLIFSCAALLFFIFKAECGTVYAIIAALISCMFTDITSYNNLLFLFTLLIYLINKRDPSSLRNMVLGILAALAIWSRQTSGSVVFIAEVIYLIIESRKIKTGFKKLLPFAGGFVGINLLFLIYLISSSSFFAFWDYCLFGLASYSNVLKGSDPMGMLMLVIVIAVLTGEFFLLMKKDFLRTLSHMLLTLALLTVLIPTVDITHAIFAFFMSLIPLMSLIKANISNPLKIFVGWGTAAVLVFMIARSLIPLFSDISYDPSCSELDLIPMSGAESGFIAVRDRNRDYKADGYDVIVLSSCSAIISIYDGSFNPPYDLFLVGSFGTTDPVDIVREQIRKDNTIIVMPDDYIEENWMNPAGIYECVTENCTPVDRVGRFVYYVPKV
ncbi:MAG: hypothetical protein K5643_03105 [Saccharofermentans sp.]|nr:hypothetical protein [Saccharofermentans sp.]